MTCIQFFISVFERKFAFKLYYRQLSFNYFNQVYKVTNYCDLFKWLHNDSNYHITVFFGLSRYKDFCLKCSFRPSKILKYVNIKANSKIKCYCYINCVDKTMLTSNYYIYVNTGLCYCISIYCLLKRNIGIILIRLYQFWIFVSYFLPYFGKIQVKIDFTFNR